MLRIINSEISYRYYDVAKKFRVPNWIVDVRHESSHGHLPSEEVLIAALAFAIQWLRVNYWTWESENSANPDDFKSNPAYESSHKLLDCYGYLKIYSIWGTDTIGELRDQEELYAHVTDLWNEFSDSRMSQAVVPTKKSKKKKQKPSTPFLKSVDAVKIKEAVTLVHNQINSVLQTNPEVSGQIFIQSLVHDDLLLPSKDFLENLKEAKESKQNILPSNLVRMWSDVLKLFDQAGLIPDLMSVLLMKWNSSKDKIERGLSSAWISKLIRSQHSITDESSQEMLNDFIDEYLKNPDNNLIDNLPTLAKLRSPVLTPAQVNRIKKVYSIFVLEDVGDIELSMEEETGMKSVDDILPSKKMGQTWTECTNVDWSRIPLGLCPGQDMDDYQQSVFKNPDSCDDTHEKETPPLAILGELKDHKDLVETVDWNLLLDPPQDEIRKQDRLPEEERIRGLTVPAFYRRQSNVGTKRKHQNY